MALVAVIGLGGISTPTNTDAYSVNETYGINYVSDLPAKAVESLSEGYTDEGDKVVYTEKEMLDEIVDNAYLNVYRKKNYIIKSTEDLLNSTYWSGYASACADVCIGIHWKYLDTTATVDGYYYHSIEVEPYVSSYSSALKVWDEYDIKVREIEQEIGLTDGTLNGNLCDGQKVILVYYWASQNKNDENFDNPEISELLGTGCGQTAIKAALFNDAACAGWARLFNRFMHDVNIESYYYAYIEPGINHAENLLKYNNKYYMTDLDTCQVEQIGNQYLYNQLLYINVINKDIVLGYKSINNYVDIENNMGNEYINPFLKTNPEVNEQNEFHNDCEYCNNTHHTYPVSETHYYKTIERVEPTCEDGYIKRKCETCGEEVTYPLKGSHSYTIEYRDADESSGRTLKIGCSDCNRVLFEEVEELPITTEEPTETITTDSTTEETSTAEEVPTGTETQPESTAEDISNTTNVSTENNEMTSTIMAQETSNVVNTTKIEDKPNKTTSANTEKKAKKPKKAKISLKKAKKKSLKIKMTSKNAVKFKVQIISKVQYNKKNKKKKKMKWAKARIINKVVTNKKDLYNISSLKKNTTYYIRVKGINKDGVLSNKWSKTLTVKTAKK